MLVDVADTNKHKLRPSGDCRLFTQQPNLYDHDTSNSISRHQLVLDTRKQINRENQLICSSKKQNANEKYLNLRKLDISNVISIQYCILFFIFIQWISFSIQYETSVSFIQYYLLFINNSANLRPTLKLLQKLSKAFVEIFHILHYFRERGTICICLYVTFYPTCFQKTIA